MSMTEIALKEPVPEDYRPVYFLNVREKSSFHVITVKPPNILMQGQRVGGMELDRTEINIVLDWIQETVEEIRSELRKRADILDIPLLPLEGGES